MTLLKRTILLPASQGDSPYTSLCLTEFRSTDVSRLVSIFDLSTSGKLMYPTLLAIPCPYTPADAHYWISLCQERAKQEGAVLDFAIRSCEGQQRDDPGGEDEGLIVGGISFKSDRPLIRDAEGRKLAEAPVQVEIGYWLDPAYWKRGVMSRCVRALSDVAFAELGVERCVAIPFKENIGESAFAQKR